jgi:hypothetical protein
MESNCKGKNRKESENMHGTGRKREWSPMEGEHEREAQLGAGGAHGEVIEKEMKKLRLAQDYDGETTGDVILG